MGDSAENEERIIKKEKWFGDFSKKAAKSLFRQVKEEMAKMEIEHILTIKIPLNPTPFLNQLRGKDIIVKLKWGLEYRGKLTCADAYMNLRLSNAKEFVDDELMGSMSNLLIRCNNILYIRESGETETS